MMTEREGQIAKYPIRELYRSLKDHPAFADFCNHAEKIIENERSAFFTIDEDKKVNAESQRIKVKHYQEFWDKLNTYILNTLSGRRR